MIDDAFKLTIDKLFPKPYTYEESTTHFKVPGYTNTENLWEYIHTNKRMTPTGIGVTIGKENVSAKDKIEITIPLTPVKGEKALNTSLGGCPKTPASKVKKIDAQTKTEEFKVIG